MVRVDPFSPLGFLFLQNNRAVAADSAEIGFFFIFFFISQAFLRITAEIGESNESVGKKRDYDSHPLSSCHWPYDDMVRYRLRPTRNISMIVLFHPP